MSRIGKNPVAVPEGVEASVNGRDITIKGKKGQLSLTVPSTVEFDFTDGTFSFSPRHKTKPSRAAWGMARAITANMVKGVSEGFERKLELRGVGYRAAVQGRKLNLTVGYSHPVNLDLPEGVDAAVNDTTEIVLTSHDKQKLGQFAANVRGVRPPEPYKGKGIRYADERIVMKEGKKK